MRRITTSCAVCVFLFVLSMAACQSLQRPSMTWSSGARGSSALELRSQEPLSGPLELPASLTGDNKPGTLGFRLRKVIPAQTPSFVPRQLDSLDLFIADPAPEEGWFGFYRGACGVLGDVCSYRAILFRRDGERVWDLDLNQFLSRTRHVEIQDIRYHEGKLYFNEACATYAQAADGLCSFLVRVDPRQGQEEWRTLPLISNNIFIFHDPYVITGYGFPAEPDRLYLVDQRTGTRAARASLDAAHQYLEIQNNRLYVVTYHSLYTFALPSTS